jgi:predicted NUDIX family NTP pyrophosphohydrolase
VPPLSTALLCYRRNAEGQLEVLIIHPGGPYFSRKNVGVWSIPKGECEPGEEFVATARREFEEEVGCPPPDGVPIELGEVRQRNGKRVVAFALPADESIDFVGSNEFEIEWPPRSGRRQRFPEADRGGWFDLAAARPLLVEAQAEFLGRLEAALAEVP